VVRGHANLARRFQRFVVDRALRLRGCNAHLTARIGRVHVPPMQRHLHSGIHLQSFDMTNVKNP